MIVDLIIPAYNAKQSIEKTLFSIALQRVNFNFNVYIVNDASDYDYSDLVQYYSLFFNVKEIVLKDNVGPGLSRNFGIEAGNGDFIVFIDSDDYFYSPLSLQNLFNAIVKNNADLIISNFICERDNERVVKKNDHVWLHGKIYKREFLKKNNIRFNHTRANEDNGFNQLIILLDAKIFFIDDVTYVYAENSKSITRKENRQYQFDGLEGFTYNILWAINEGIKRNCDLFFAVEFSLTTLIAMYYYYLEFLGLYDVKKIVYWSKDLYVFYRENCNLITNDIINHCLSIKQDEYLKHGKVINEVISFDAFLKKVGDLID